MYTIIRQEWSRFCWTKQLLYSQLYGVALPAKDHVSMSVMYMQLVLTVKGVDKCQIAQSGTCQPLSQSAEAASTAHSCTHGPLQEAKLHRAGSATNKRSTAEQSGTCQPLSQSAKPDVHHTHTHMVLCRKRNSIELAVQQQGSEATKRSTVQQSGT